MEINVQSTSIDERDTNNLLSDQGVMKFEVTLSEPSAGTVTVAYRTRQGTAEENDDYDSRFDPVEGTLTFEPDETLKTVEIATSVDDLDETDEFIELELFDPTGGATLAGDGPTLRATGWILDNDGSADDLAFRVSDPLLREGDSGAAVALFEAELSRASDTAISVPWSTASNTALAGEDFTAASGTFDFAPGQTRAVATVDVSGDEDIEPTETFFLVADTGTTPEIHSGSAGTVGTATILDDDAGPRTLSVADASTRERDTSNLLSDQGMLRFAVTLSEPSSGTVSVDYRAVPGSAQAADFGEFGPATEGTLTFESGQTTAWINILTAQDDDDEVDEALELILSNPVGAVLAGGTPELTAVGWILDDDGAPEDRAIYVPDSGIVEGDSGTADMVFQPRISRSAEIPAEVGFSTSGLTAQPDTDFQPRSGSVTFAAGQTQSAVRVPIIGDEIDETATETFALNFTPDTELIFSGPGFSATGTITDDDFTNSPPEGSVTLSGTAEEGSTLTADTSSVADADGLGAFGFQWLRDGVAIDGATSADYTPLPADIGAEIAVRVGYTDGEGTEETLLSAASAIAPRSGTAGDDSILGGPLDDRLEGLDGDDTLEGGPGDDGLLGGAGDDMIDGGDGDDNIAASDGNDVVDGGPGDDLIGGGPGNDELRGGAGDDFMGGGLGDDLMDGGPGNDVVNGGPGDDTLDGGTGNDTMGGSFGDDVLRGGDGNDDMGGGAGQDTIDAGAGDDSVGGGEGDDSITGGAGDDFLAGGGRNDVMDGGAGDDTINGGDGDDTMEGGEGADVFVFNFFKEQDRDVITDFEDGVDSFLIRTVNLETGEANIDNGGNGLQGFVDALNITDVEGGAQLNVDGHLVLVEGVAAADLGVEDFVFL